jgi:hypothetical protein
MLREILLTLTITIFTVNSPVLAHDLDIGSASSDQPWQGMPAPPKLNINPWRDYVPVVTAADQQRTSRSTQRQSIRIEQNRQEASLPNTATAQYGMHPGVILSVHQLPPTRLSSFVADSGYNENVYGDEGTDSRPPIDGFEYDNTIESGLCNCGGEGLTTGHHADADMTHGYQWYASGQVDYDPTP